MTHDLNYRFITKLKTNIKIELFKCHTEEGDKKQQSHANQKILN